MTLIVALAAFSIDVAQWQVGRHRAQVAADAAALAAANCLASLDCTSTTPGGDAEQKADAIAADNGFTDKTKVNVTFPDGSGKAVKVRVQATAASSFAGLFGMPSETVSASSTASYTTSTSEQWPCPSGGASNCYSLVAGNSACPTAPTTMPPYIGLGFASKGGGRTDIEDAYSNGLVDNNADANDTHNITVPGTSASGAVCSNDRYKAKNTTLSYVTAPPSYPVVWTQPTCDSSNTATYWTTDPVSGHTIGAPGVYCVTAAPSPSCVDDGQNNKTTMSQGYIYVDLKQLSGTGYEFVGPCVSLTGTRAAAPNITGEPLVYGTSNIETAATATSWPECGTSDTTTTYLDGNNSLLGAPIYDQCGTFEATSNNDTSTLTGFVEAWNIGLDKNNFTVQGTGPTSITDPQVTTLPGTDSLSG